MWRSAPNPTDTWDNIDSRHDHPTMLAPLGILPGTGVGTRHDGAHVGRRLKRLGLETKIWGWDYPMIAMTAARLDRPETAVEILLREGRTTNLPNGLPLAAQRQAAKSPKRRARKRELRFIFQQMGAFLSAVET